MSDSTKYRAIFLSSLLCTLFDTPSVLLNSVVYFRENDSDCYMINMAKLIKL